MAGTESVGELLKGWSYVVHRPSEDPEPSELPSTVDMAAFSTELNAEPTENTQVNNSSDSESDSDSDSNNSGSDESGSCSQSDSSDSDSSSSSQDSASRPASPEFSVTSSQTNGLRLTIQTVRKSCNSPVDKPSSKAAGGDAKASDKNVVVKSCNLSSSSSAESESECESESGDKSDNNSNSKSSAKPVKDVAKKYGRKVRTKAVEKKHDKRTPRKDVNASPKVLRPKTRSKRNQKMASLPISRGSTYSSSDSDDSDADSAMLASCSLQEINQEDLAAILPDQQEIDTFGGFECRTDKNSSQTVIEGDASGSDMELPQQAVNALIQRTTESSSECESHAPPNPSTLYANSLLQQFVAQTQLLNAPSAVPPSSSEIVNNLVPLNQTDVQNNSSADIETIKRKRGRPRKFHKGEVKATAPKTTLKVEYSGDPNVSPDSGIQNSPDHVSSPEASPIPNTGKTKFAANQSEKKNGASKKPKAVEATKTTNKLKEQNKLPVTSNRFDRVLYGNTDRVLYPPRRKVGRPPIHRKGPGRPPKHKPAQSIPADTSNKAANESAASAKNSTAAKPSVKVEKVDAKLNKNKKPQKNNHDKDIVQITSNTHNLTLGKLESKTKDTTTSKKSKILSLNEICERVSRRLEQNSNKPPQKASVKQDPKLDKNHKTKTLKNHKISFPTKNKMDKIKSKYTTIKNAKLMHSKHKHKKHKKCKFKILKPITSAHPDPKLHGEVEKLVQDFMKCLFISPKAAKEPVMEIIKVFKKTSKKRKASEHTERKKGKKQNTTNSINKETNSNEQRLPLKKRHYHLSASNDSKPEITPVSTEPEPKVDKKLKENKLPVPAGIKNSPTNNLAKTSLSLVKVNCTSPKTPGINNNDYEVKTKSVGSHIDEAIEACITRYSSTKDLAKQNIKEEKSEVVTAVPEEKSNIPVGTITTPKKRHLLEIANNSNEVTKLNLSSIAMPKNEEPAKPKTGKPLENVVSEIKMKRNLSPKFPEVNQKKAESVAQIITRKKNRLEDLTSSLVSKITPPTNESPEHNSQKRKVLKLEELCTRASVIKYPICKKAKPAEPEKLDSVVDEKPTGIFTPTVDLELHIPTSLVPNSSAKEGVLPKNEIQSPTIEEEADSKLTPSKEAVDVTPPPPPIKKASLTTAESSLRKRIRKRRAINRTGFPTVKKKKKKFPSECETLELKEESNVVCDRVPKEGEKYLSFLQRTECTVSVVALEKLQLPQELTPVLNDSDPVSKWEVLSECDSLPQEDRIEFESSELDVKHIKRIRDVSPSTSIETRSSDRLKQKRDFTPESRDCNTDDDLTLESRLEKNRLLMKKHNRLKSRRFRNFERRKTRYCDDDVDFKKRLRDLSPASSTDLVSDKRSRDDHSDDSKRIKKAPRWRKRYLAAGLFSDYYKEDDETARLKRNESMSNKSRLVYNPQEHPYGLLPAPYHCGKYLRCRKLPFQLPYDLWWQHTHSQLPGRDAVPSWNYRKIRTNVYNIKTTTGTCEPQPCNCTPCDGCGDDCINRLVLAECPASHKCQNQRIQKHEWSPGIEKFMTDSKGWGVRTNLPIKNGEFILEYVGEVVSDQEFKERMATRYVNDTHHYCLHLDGGLVIDGHRMGGDGRFVNHSCQPNCEMQKWSVNGQFRMALFALRDIHAGEELTYDYNFSLFNPAEGQECKCGSDICRGVIGGKSQRVRQSTAPPPTSNGTGRVGRPRKNQAKRTLSGPKEIPVAPVAPPVIPPPQVKPLTQAQKAYILEHHCFLLRNFYKVKKVKRGSTVPPVSRAQTSTPTDHGSTFLSHINALRQPRNMKTRRLAQVEDDPELHKTAKLANFLRDLWNIVVKAKDEKNQQLCNPFISLPSKRKVPEYYQRIADPIDLTIVEQNIATGIYKSPENFDADMNRLFANAVKFYGRTSELGIAATRLKKIYVESKQESTSKFENLLGEKPSNNFLCSNNKGEEEDVIRCICGMYRDEGLMIQCERCLVWQHCECVQADPSAASYHCERCTPREVDFEIAMNEYTEHGHRYYMTLLRGALQLRQGDTVYVLRDIPIPGTDRKHTYDTIGEIKYTDLDIFRIERLWKDCKTGQRFAYGHHYLRPHETYHEPTRKFFPNEVMRVPLYEAVPVELVISHCWVMDLNTFCKGRPIGAPEEHIYICEYRVDKTARLFSKVSKSKYPLCTKSYAFERFDVRLKISRTYTPHDLDPALVKPRGRKAQESEDVIREIPQIPVHVPIVRTRSEQKARLNKILLNLLSKLPTKQPLDVSYLLEGGRRRKKTT